MPIEISEKSGKVKKSKLEKIFELETEVKILKRENERLNGLLEERRASIGAASDSNNDNNSNSNFSNSREGGVVDEESSDALEIRRMKEAFVALKNVAITQEKSLHAMRTRALERRKELESKDREIATLRKRVKTLQKIQEGLAKAKGTTALQGEFDELQLAYFEEQNTTAKLQAEVAEKEKAISSLQALLKAKTEAVESSPKLGSSPALVAQLKKELGKKSKEVAELQHQVETLNEELHSLQSRLTTGRGPSQLTEPCSILDESDYLDTEHGLETERTEDDPEHSSGSDPYRGRINYDNAEIFIVD